MTGRCLPFVVAVACSSPAVVAPRPCVTAPVASPPQVADVDPAGEWEVRWDRTFAGWRPPMFAGTMSVRRSGATWAVDLHFTQSAAIFVLEKLAVDGERVRLTFHTTVKPDEHVEIDAHIHAGRWIGEMRWVEVGWTPFSARPLPQLHPAHVDHSLPLGEPLDAKALLATAAEERSSAIVVLKDGKVVVESYLEKEAKPIMAMSASKSVVALAVALLVADGKLTLETRMGTLFPAWKNLGPKANITVRQLMNHTSGLDPSRARFDGETIREHTLKAKLLFTPGSRFQYNNNAVDFLGVVIKQAAGVPLDELLQKRLFDKLDMVDAHFLKDPEGTPRGAGELIIRPIDLAKLGQLMLNDGQWNGEQVLPAGWAAKLTEPSQTLDERCGLLWWREGTFSSVITEAVLAGWQDLGVDAEALKAARTLVGRKFASEPELRAALVTAMGESAFAKLSERREHADHVPLNANVLEGTARGYTAHGWLGQIMVVYPDKHVVAVRMRRSAATDYEDRDTETFAYPSFASDVRKLFE
jgi:CubicO group peptidase (beta-lactamase class C family)